MQALDDLAALSRRYGADPAYVFLGGGNTSFKTDELLYIKPSGVALATIQAGEFIAMDRAALRRLLTRRLPADVWAREAAVKAHMLEAVRPAGAGRPSVEAPLHEAIATPFVVHLHPAWVNGLTCARDGEAACRALFPDALWVGYCNPGHTLATTVAARLEAATATAGRQPRLIFLQNHGVFVGGETPAEVETAYARIMGTLAEAYRRAGVATSLADAEPDPATVLAQAPRLRTWLGSATQRALVTAAGPFAPAAGPFSPDHIIYARAFPYVGVPDADGIQAFTAAHGYLPRIVACENRAVFAADATLKSARDALVAARDAALVQQLSAAFGGPRFLGDAERGFIENWEVEAYRRSVAVGAAGAGRLARRVCLVTGAAQGFGLGIAEGLAAHGGVVGIADLNLDGARAVAADLERRHGAGTAFAVAVNVADEDSVAGMVAAAVRTCGGVDVLVANAGVLRAGPLTTFAKKDWDFVTGVNYTGYFLCVKHVAPVMAAQTQAGPGPWCDILQINSKSGLDGSSRNAAYAGTKFGAIGLTQSFAKELIEDRIKVNSICPGNFFDGPLWSDPQNGLFVQYLRAGKVPGATTVADVRRAYEAKTPMGRGCTPADVVCAVLYAIEQEYETGQAIAVTGGQVMLR